jgi:hypothetical protein
MEGGSVDELLDVTVERPVVDQLQVEIGRTLKDWVQPGLTGDHREERHLHAVDQPSGHQRPVHRQAALRAQRHLGLLPEPGDDVDGPIAAYCQADVIDKHTKEITGGLTYAQLPKNDPNRQTAMQSAFLQASLFTSIVAFGVAAMAVVVGIVMAMVGFAIRTPPVPTAASSPE